MATKKQKREAAEAKRERFMAELARSNREALERSRDMEQAQKMFNRRDPKKIAQAVGKMRHA